MKIIIGAAQFGGNYGVANKTGKVSNEDISNILKYAFRHNIKTIDTAVNYGDCERRLGQHDISTFSIISKLPSVLNLN